MDHINHFLFGIYPYIALSVFLLGTGSGLRERMVQREREALQRRQDRP